jgi:hypothetical protein
MSPHLDHQAVKNQVGIRVAFGRHPLDCHSRWLRQRNPAHLVVLGMKFEMPLSPDCLNVKSKEERVVYKKLNSTRC